MSEEAGPLVRAARTSIAVRFGFCGRTRLRDGYVTVGTRRLQRANACKVLRHSPHWILL